MMTQNRALTLIRRHHPATTSEFRRIGLAIYKLGSGCFRTGYRIRETDLVVKFPQNSVGKYHTTLELKRIAQLKKYSSLRPHLPPVYYHNKKTGVLVTRFYRRGDRHDNFWTLGVLLAKLIREKTGVELCDIREDNMRLGGQRKRGRDRCVLIDLGY
jgi:hypothetical protein